MTVNLASNSRLGHAILSKSSQSKYFDTESSFKESTLKECTSSLETIDLLRSENKKAKQSKMMMEEEMVL